MGYFSWCCATGAVCVDYENNVWQIGRSKEEVPIIRKISNLRNIKYVSCYGYSTACVSYDGEVFGAGSESKHFFGDTSSVEFKQIPHLPPISDIACGYKKLMCIDYDKLVWILCEEGNSFGLPPKTKNQIKNEISKPILIPNLQNIIKIALSYSNAFALDENGDIFACGSNNGNQISNTHSTEVIQTFIKIEGLNDIIDLSCGAYHYLFLNKDGQVFSGGSNFHGELGRKNRRTRNIKVIKSLPPIRNVMTSGFGSKCIDGENCLWVFGQNYCGDLGVHQQDIFIPLKLDLQNIDFVSTGGKHTIVKCLNGEIFVFGENNSNQLGFEKSPNDKENLIKSPVLWEESKWNILRQGTIFSKAKSARK